MDKLKYEYHKLKCSICGRKILVEIGLVGASHNILVKVARTSVEKFCLGLFLCLELFLGFYVKAAMLFASSGLPILWATMATARMHA